MRRDLEMISVGIQRWKIVLILFSVASLMTMYWVVSMQPSNPVYVRAYMGDGNFVEDMPGGVAMQLHNEANQYALTIVGKGGLEEIIFGHEIGLVFRAVDWVQGVPDAYSYWNWLNNKLGSYPHGMAFLVEYDSEALDARLDRLAVFDETATVISVSARPEFDGERFVMVGETIGTVADREMLIGNLRQAFVNGRTTLNLEEIGAYITPRFTVASSELAAAIESLNAYVATSVTYDLNPKQVVVDAPLIATWLSWDENLTVTLQEDRVRAFMHVFVTTYSTFGTTRTFTNPLGREVQVFGGSFGWQLDEYTEANALLHSIRHGEVAVRHPAHFRAGQMYEGLEWGNTFAQVDLSGQHMWLFVNGELAMESPVVTGMAHSSPTNQGVYTVLNMLSPTVLRGPVVDEETGRREWEAPVSYWMQTTWYGVGFHDATWQPYFGGTRFQYGGSRGCINLPLDAARQLFGMAYNGMPVIVHH
ncbi:MAG: L,D-transpeptidase [Lachnospiraceae bacterium]|nr:L,D-transpeptidase [Lachnospiraceae bacterium]